MPRGLAAAAAEFDKPYHPGPVASALVPGHAAENVNDIAVEVEAEVAAAQSSAAPLGRRRRCRRRWGEY